MIAESQIKQPYLYHWVRLLQVFLPKLVLEVFGATGAIWGFSEAIGIRTSDTNWFWRPVSLLVGSCFLARWVHQIRIQIQPSVLVLSRSTSSSSSTGSFSNSSSDHNKKEQDIDEDWSTGETSSLLLNQQRLGGLTGPFYAAHGPVFRLSMPDYET